MAEHRVLAIDVGGSHVKILVTGETTLRRFVSGDDLTPQRTVEGVLEEVGDWQFDVVSIGIPAPIKGGRVAREPANLGDGWVEFDFEHAFSRPTKIVNDAAMQALGSYEGGMMLFLGLGTGLGSALVVEPQLVVPMELAHLPFRKATFEDYVGSRGLKRAGRKKWQKAVDDAVTTLSAALAPDYVVLGGGNADKLDGLPENARLGSNENAFVGGFRLWRGEAKIGR